MAQAQEQPAKEPGVFLLGHLEPCVALQRNLAALDAIPNPGHLNGECVVQQGDRSRLLTPSDMPGRSPCPLIALAFHGAASLWCGVDDFPFTSPHHRKCRFVNFQLRVGHPRIGWDEPEWEVGEEEEFFRPGSRRYPEWEEG